MKNKRDETIEALLERCDLSHEYDLIYDLSCQDETYEQAIEELSALFYPEGGDQDE